MLRRLGRATPWPHHSDSGHYVCHSCRQDLQTLRRLQSTAAAITETGGGDDWASNFNDLSSGLERHGARDRVPAEETASVEKSSARKVAQQQSLAPPRTRSLSPDHPAVARIRAMPTAVVEAALRRARKKFEASIKSPNNTGPHAPCAAEALRKTAFTRTPATERHRSSGLSKKIGLFERALELSRAGELPESSLGKYNEGGGDDGIAVQQRASVSVGRQSEGPLVESERKASTPGDKLNSIVDKLLGELKDDADHRSKDSGQTGNTEATAVPASSAGGGSAQVVLDGDAAKRKGLGLATRRTSERITDLELLLAGLRNELARGSEGPFPVQVRDGRTVSHKVSRRRIANLERRINFLREKHSTHIADPLQPSATDAMLDANGRQSKSHEPLLLASRQGRHKRERTRNNGLEAAITDEGMVGETTIPSSEAEAVSDQNLVQTNMPTFAAMPEQSSSLTPVSATEGMTVAQKVRELISWPKRGSIASGVEEGRPASGAGSTSVGKHSAIEHAGDVPKEAAIPSTSAFIDSAAEQLELSADATIPTNVSANTHHHSEKEATLSTLLQSLSSEIMKRDSHPLNGKRITAIERNINGLRLSTSSSSGPNDTVADENASESLANLHRSSAIVPKARQEGRANKTTPGTSKGKLDQSQSEKPAVTGGRKKRRRSARAETKRSAAAKSGSEAFGLGGNDGDHGEHKSLWKVMQAAQSTLESARQPPSATKEASKPTASEASALESSYNAPPSISVVKAADLHIDALKIPQPPVPGLQYDLERVLFNPGVYQLQDPMSRVYNFDPYLQDIMPAVEFDFNALKEYKTSSEDKALAAIAKKYQKRYIGSTSSMTSTLAHFHYLISNWRTLNLNMLSRGLTDQAAEFTKINKAPIAIFLRWKPESRTYAIDADKEFDGANVLMMLGKSMEKMLTLPTSEFEKYRKSDPREVSEAARDEPEAFEYTTMGDFLMRSQLDAHDPRLPGTGMFDLKTRAVLSVRMNAEDFEPMLGYEIHTLQGRWNSYEREYYDMMRSTMLKYMLQARMGRMQGIFAAYHNIERIFGFQYIPMMDMDRAIHGQIDPCLGDQEFKVSLKLLNQVLDKATAKFPEESLRLHFETSQQNLDGDATPVMSIFAEPMEEKEIQRIQSLSKEKVREFERKMMGIEERVVKPSPSPQAPTDYPPSTPVPETDEQQETTAPEEVADQAPTEYPPATPEPNLGTEQVAAERCDSEDQAPTEYPPATPEPPREAPEASEPEPEDDSAPTTYPPATPEPPSSSEVSSNPDLTSSTSSADPTFLASLSSTTSHLSPLFSATLMTKSRVNGTHVARPGQLKPEDGWAVEYLLSEHPESEATWARYATMKARRKDVLSNEKDEDADVPSPRPGGEQGKKAEKKPDQFIQFLRDLSRRGREFRSKLDAAEQGTERKVAWRRSGDDGAGAAPDATVTDGAWEPEGEDVAGYMAWLYEADGVRKK